MKYDFDRPIHPLAWTDAAGRLGTVLRHLLDDLPPPSWWQIRRRLMWDRDKNYALMCAHYGWPDWLNASVKLGLDRDMLVTMAKLVGHPVPEPGRKTYSYPKTPI